MPELPIPPGHLAPPQIINWFLSKVLPAPPGLSAPQALLVQKVPLDLPDLRALLVPLVRKAPPGLPVLQAPSLLPLP